MGLIGGGDGWFWGESGVGFEVGVGLNSGGEGLRFTAFELLVWGMQAITDRTNLNRLFAWR